MFSSGSSNYFFKLDPKRFGSKQDDYLRRVNEIVTITTNNIQRAVNEKIDLIQFFYDTLDFLGTMRNNIAIIHGTPHANMHGKQRYDRSSTSVVMHTDLYEVYAEYNQRLMSTIQNLLRTMPYTSEKFQQTELKITRKSCSGKNTLIDLAILSTEKRNEWGIEVSRANYERICAICSIIPLDESNSIGKCLNHLMTRDIISIIQKKSIEDYNRLKTSYITKNIHAKFAGCKSDWVLITVYYEVNGKMLALTQYLTWMYLNNQHDPIDFMTSRLEPTMISLIHQDVFLIQETLKEIANLFKEIIVRSNLEPQELIQHIGLINYLFAHAMPFERGSSAIAEWLEMAIYRYHGFNLLYNEEFNINMEALILPLDEFIEKYHSMIKLEPIVKNNCTTKAC